MADFILRFEGADAERRRLSCGSLDEARNEAVRHLGAYLTEHPEYASDGHWRVNVDNAEGMTLLHIIVATVNAVSPIPSPPESS